MKIHNKKNKTLKGGNVIASGGYGCIFRPALKCISKKYEKNQVSKLMTIKHIKEEYNDIVKYKPYLEKIPNYKKYFLIDGFSICTPDKLSPSDLKDYDSKCKALKKDGFTSENINNSLNKVLSLNIPYGGLDVGDFIETIISIDQLIVLNISLIEILLKGILPMNKYDIYHCDIKESNILVNKTNEMTTILIDWGLSAKYDGENIPKQMYERPLQYNLPYSIILFNDIFKKKYIEFLKEKPNPNYYNIRAFVIDYIFFWNEKRGPGHIKYMIGIMESLFDHTIMNIDKNHRREIIEMEFTYYYIIEYLTQVLLKFTRDGNFMIKDYFNKVFLKIVDVWGLIITYYPILNILHNNYEKLDDIELKLFNKLKYIFLHYLFEPRTEAIQIQNLVEDLKELNLIFKMANKNKIAKSIISLTKSYRSKKSSKKSTHKNKKQSRTLYFISTAKKEQSSSQ